jgi:hypothetical protein
MKKIPAENVKQFLSGLEATCNRLQFSDAIWNDFARIAWLYFGSTMAITRGTITEKIGIFWHIKDVQDIRPDLTNEQASEVLKSLKMNHDAAQGINWDIIEITANDLFPEPNIELSSDNNEVLLCYKPE